MPPLTWQRLSNVRDMQDHVERVTADESLPLFRGLLHAVVGEGESGKTWVGAHSALNVAQNLGQVLILDGEMSAPAWRRRLDALGANGQDRQLIAYSEMDARSSDVEAIVETCRALCSDSSWPAVGLLLWDSALSMLSQTVRSENDNVEVGKVYDKLRAVLRRTNAAGLIVDHTTRGSAALISRGATAKFNALDISYGVRVADDCIPGPIEPWSSVISVEKDRHALLGKRADREASFFPLSQGGLELSITQRDSATHRLSAGSPVAKARHDIEQLDPPPTSGNDAYRRIKGNRKAVLTAFKLWQEDQA